jgi:hypothetical protein
VRPFALAVAFLLELIAFCAFAGAGFLLPGGLAVQWVAAIALFVALIAFWGRFMAPRAARQLGGAPYYAAKLCIYAVSAAVIVAFGGVPLGAAFGIAALLDETLLFAQHRGR